MPAKIPKQVAHRSKAQIFSPSSSLFDSVYAYIGQADSVNYPLVTQIHLASLHALANQFIDEGVLGSNAALLINDFIDRHDVGYAIDLKSLLSDSSSLDVINRLAASLGSEIDATKVVDYLNEYRQNYLASRVIGHGLTGLVANTRHYTEKGMDANCAFGLAVLFAAHHPGFPVDMVSNSLHGTSSEIPDELRSLLLVDNAGRDAEALRQRLTQIGAESLQISFKEAAIIVSIGYGLDRLSAGRAPARITANLQPSLVDGTHCYASVDGGEVIQKKYGLVAGDLIRAGEIPTLEDFFETIINRIQVEAECAIAAASQLYQPKIAQLLCRKARLIIEHTRQQQQTSLEAIGTNPLLNLGELMAARDALVAQGLSTNQSIGVLYAVATLEALIASCQQMRR